MTEFEDWTQEDDELVRAALNSLRRDVDPVALAPAPAVRARGAQRRRRNWLVGGISAAAAAALVVGAVSLSGLGDGRQANTDPAGSTTISSSPTPSGGSPTADAPDADYASWLGQQSLLPIAEEWRAALWLDGAPSVTEGQVPGLLCELPTGDGTAVTAQEVSAAGAPAPFATQTVFRYADEQAAAAAAGAMTSALEGCQAPKPETITRERLDTYSSDPVLFSFSDSDGNAGWVTITQRGRDLAYVELWSTSEGDGATATLDQFARLTSVVENRLEAYGAKAASGAGPGDTLPIAGPPGDTTSADLFVDPAAFASDVLSAGLATEAAEGEFEGSPQVTLACDADTSIDGVFGLMNVREARNPQGFFATQRVRQVTGEGDAADLVAEEIARLRDGFTGCTVTEGNTTTKAYEGPLPGMFKLATTFGDDSQAVVEYVAVTATTTPGHASTIVVNARPGTDATDESYFVELERLSTLAAQR